MRYRFVHDSGTFKFRAKHDVEAQQTAREHLKKLMLFPQRRKNYLYRFTFWKRTWNNPRAFWRWEEMPI